MSSVDNLKIYVINLDSRPDRWEKIQEEFNRVGITNYERFSAIRPVALRPDFLKGKPEGYRIGCYGCLLSHMCVIQKAKEEGLKEVLIIEDDVGFKQPISVLDDVLTQFIQSDESFDMLYLSGSHIAKCSQVLGNIVRVHNTLTTSSYIIRESIYDYVIENLKNFNREIDVFYSECVQFTCYCYCTNPHITYQKNDFSDIQQRNVLYSMSDP